MKRRDLFKSAFGLAAVAILGKPVGKIVSVNLDGTNPVTVGTYIPWSDTIVLRTVRIGSTTAQRVDLYFPDLKGGLG